MILQSTTHCPSLYESLGAVCFCVFWAILFLQSGFDKITDRKGNLEWLIGHFSKSFLKGTVPLLLTTLTLFEIATGFVCIAAIVEIVWLKTFSLAQLGATLSAVSLLMLFFGQRIAKDYAGAATIAMYFLAAMVNLGMLCLSL